MEVLVVVLLVVLLIRWWVLSQRFAEMRRRISGLEEGRDIGPLIQRMHALEVALERRQAAPAQPPPAESIPIVATKIPEPEPMPLPPPLPEFCGFCGKVLPPPPALCACRTAEDEDAVPEIVTEAPVIPPPLPAGPTLGQRIREQMAGEEWEVLVGGSLLNKLGVFVLVIGVALFLGYSFTQIGPLGRASIGLALSLAMLTGGFIVERRDRYKIFARGLVGGGWAALYFTTYAMQALDAAKVIDNPVLGAVLLLAVAVGMIAHSLRYRSQTVTGLAYFVAFVSLAITQVTTLSVVALVPLAASLLYVAQRFEWSEMALFGLIATYGTCASRGDNGAPAWLAQTLFSVYWLLFEGFDLLRARRRTPYRIWESAILPMNAFAFVGLSYAKWSASAPASLHALAAGIAAAYLVSTILRTAVRPPSSFAAETATLERALSGGYEGPVTLTAILSAAAVLLKFHGNWAILGLLAEAELLFVVGLLFREGYPRQLAATLFTAGIGRLLVVDIPNGGTQRLGDRTINLWTPVAAFAGLLFYINRALRPADKFYGYAASAVFAFILAFETPERFLGFSWLLMATVLFTFGWLRRLEDFRIQGYLASGLGLGATAVHQANVAAGIVAASKHPWIALSSAALVSYAGVLCALRSAGDRLGDWERDWLPRVGSWATTAALLTLSWRMLPDKYTGLGWLAVSLLLLELGIRRLPKEFRAQSYVAAGLGTVWVLFVNALPIRNDALLLEASIPAGAALLLYAFAGRVFRARAKQILEPEAGVAIDLSSATGTLFLLFGLWALLPPAIVAPAWALASLLLVETGFGFDLPIVRLQGHLAGAASFGRLFFANFEGLGNTGGVSHRLLTVVPVLVSHYYQWSRQHEGEARLRDWERRLGRGYLYTAAIAMVVLLRFELGRVYTVVGWAAFALALLIVGQHWKKGWSNPDLRWQSYAIAALAFWRSLTTNFYSPESLTGATGRIVTGASVIACFFAAQLLIPQLTDRKGIERYARMFYSLLATVLLTVLLFHEVSGSVLTVAWGLEGLLLLTAGFPLRDRTFRLCGLALFSVCILKLFLYDLRQLDTPYRILSFIALGVILMAVSWAYTRFRDRVRRFL